MKIILLVLFMSCFLPYGVVAQSNKKTYKLVDIDTASLSEYYLLKFESIPTKDVITVISNKYNSQKEGCWQILIKNYDYNIYLHPQDHGDTSKSGYPILMLPNDRPLYSGNKLIRDKFGRFYKCNAINGLFIKISP